MVYAGGDNSLNLAIDNDLYNLVSGFTSDNNVQASYAADVNNLEKFGYTSYAGFAYVGNDHSRDLGLNPTLFNSAAPESLAMYLDWVKANWPAEHYCLIMSDHGGSWTKNASGIMVDDTVNPEIQMEVTDMASVIRQSGLPVDVLVFEACNMASVEVMNDLVGVTDYVVASETGQVGGDGYPPYPLALIANWLQANPSMSARALAVEASDFYQQTYSGIDASTTSSTINMAAIPALVSAVSDFTTTLSSQLSSHFEEILGSYETTWRNSFRDGDLGDFLSLLKANVSDGPLTQKVSAVEAQLNNTVIRNQICYDASDTQSENVDWCTGLTISMPLAGEYIFNYRTPYQTLSFDEQTHWSSFMDALQPSANCHTTCGDYMGGMITWDTSSPGSWGPELDLYVWEPLSDGNGQLAYVHGSPYSANGIFSLGLWGVNDAAYERWDALARINRGEYIFLANYVSDGPFQWSCYITFVGYLYGEEFSSVGPYYLDGQTDYGSEMGLGWISFSSDAYDRTASSAKGFRQCSLREAGLNDIQIASAVSQLKAAERVKRN